jgi:hypothetical protein
MPISSSPGASKYQKGSLAAIMAGEDTAPVFELAASVKQIKELQRLLGKKTTEVELLKRSRRIWPPLFGGNHFVEGVRKSPDGTWHTLTLCLCIFVLNMVNLQARLGAYD